METDCYCTTARAATRKVTAMYDAALESTGVNVAQFGLLRKLSDTTALSVGELARAADLERSTVTRNARVLQRQGLVDIGESKTDRRTATIVLTPEGVQTLHEGEPLWEEAQLRFESQLGVDDARALRSLLRRL